MDIDSVISPFRWINMKFVPYSYPRGYPFSG